MPTLRWLPALALLALAAPAPAATVPGCVRTSGKAGTACLAAYVATVERCRAAHDATCEAAARADDGTLATALSAPEAANRRACSEETAIALGYVGIEDLVDRIPEACRDFAEDLLDLVYADDPAALSAEARACQTAVATGLERLHARVARGVAGCIRARYGGGRCNGRARDRRVAAARTAAARRIVRTCGARFADLGLAAGDDVAAAVETLTLAVTARARHFAERVYPPNDLGPTAEFGPHPIGVRTLTLADPARLDVRGTGPRPVTVELYYPSTEAAIAGVPRDVVRIQNLDIVSTPAYRDVPLAPGTFPLVVFSHGNSGIRFQSFFFAAHLASHGYVVATPDHHGNTFLDLLAGLVDAQSAVNRPRDVSFLIDTLLAFNAEPGNFLAGAVDPERIGMSGHSFGGYTTFAIAGGEFGLGTYTDRRVRAILPQAPAAFPFVDDFFATITVPALIVGGSIDETTPFASEQQRPFDHLPAGASVVGLAEITDAGHFTFSDFCEVPRDLLAFLGGFDEACEPRHIAWRHAHDIVNYLSLNFFEATLGGDQAALARLSPRRLARIDELRYQSK